MGLSSRLHPRFNAAAGATARLARRAFMDAALSYQGQFFIEHAGKFTAAMSLGSNFLLGVRFKAPAAAFTLGDGGWAAHDRAERKKQEAKENGTELSFGNRALWWVAKPLAGAAGFTGSMMFLHYARKAGDPHFGWIVASNVPGLLESFFAVAERGIPLLSRAGEESDSVPAQVLGWIGKKADYALVKTSLLDMGCQVTVACAEHSLIMTALCSLCILGDAGVAMLDDHLRQDIEDEKAARRRIIAPDNFLTYARHGVTCLPLPA